MSITYVIKQLQDYIASVDSFENTVVVQQASDLIDIDSTKNYMIDGVVNMGSTTIIVPEGGISISGLNGARDTAVLFSDVDNHVFFASPIGGRSGGGVLESCTIDATGVGAVVWDCNNTGDAVGGAWDVTGVNFGRSPSSTIGLGQLTDYRQGLWNNIGLIFCKDGLTLNGTWTGFRATTSIAVAWPNATLFKRGTGFTIENFSSDFNFLSVNENAIFCDFLPADITVNAGFTLDGFRTTANDPLPNLPSSDLKVRHSDCTGVRGTYVGAKFKFTTGATTTISTINTPVKMAGTTTYADLTWFTGPSNNTLTFNSTIETEVSVIATLNLSGVNNNEVTIYIRKWDDSASAYENVGSTQITLDGNGNALNITVIEDDELYVDQNDRIELWIENNSGTSNINTLVGGSFRVNKRG